MNSLKIKFMDELNDFLPPQKNNVMFGYQFTGSPSIKHIIEAIGVPHPEVGEILVNFYPEELAYKVMDKDFILVKPKIYFHPCNNLKNSGQGEVLPKFVLDSHLGKLAVYLRMFGYDALYQNDYDDELIAEISSRENRILLTRDRGLLKRKIIKDGYWIRSLEPKIQIEEVLVKFNLVENRKAFQRCLICNQPLQPVEKNSVIDKLEPLTRKYFNEFYICPDCQRVYWKGSHYERMKAFIEKLINNGGSAANG